MSKTALMLIRTPLQAYLAKRVLRQEGVGVYDLIYVTHNDGPEDRHYFVKLSSEARHHLYCHVRPHRYDILNHVHMAWRARHWRRDLKHDLTLMASVDNPLFSAIATRQRQATLVTFDDGTANYLRTDPYRSGKLGLRGTFYRWCLGAPVIQQLKQNIARHYSLHPELGNIVPKEKLVTITAGFQSGAAPDAPEASFFIGQPFEEILTPEELRAFLSRVRQFPVDFYIRHPRETKPLALGVPFLEKQGLIAEEVIEQAAHGHRIRLVGGFSSVMLNMGRDIPRTVILNGAMKGGAMMEQLARDAGCQVIVL